MENSGEEAGRYAGRSVIQIERQRQDVMQLVRRPVAVTELVQVADFGVHRWAQAVRQADENAVLIETFIGVARAVHVDEQFVRKQPAPAGPGRNGLRELDLLAESPADLRVVSGPVALLEAGPEIPLAAFGTRTPKILLPQALFVAALVCEGLHRGYVGIAEPEAAVVIERIAYTGPQYAL